MKVHDAESKRWSEVSCCCSRSWRPVSNNTRDFNHSVCVFPFLALFLSAAFSLSALSSGRLVECCSCVCEPTERAGREIAVKGKAFLSSTPQRKGLPGFRWTHPFCFSRSSVTLLPLLLLLLPGFASLFFHPFSVLWRRKSEARTTIKFLSGMREEGECTSQSRDL